MSFQIVTDPLHGPSNEVLAAIAALNLEGNQP